jgi:hypothetical protein
MYVFYIYKRHHTTPTVMLDVYNINLFTTDNQISYRWRDGAVIGFYGQVFYTCFVGQSYFVRGMAGSGWKTLSTCHPFCLGAMFSLKWFIVHLTFSPVRLRKIILTDVWILIHYELPEVWQKSQDVT